MGDFKGFFGGGLRNVLYLIYIYFLLQSRLKVRLLLTSPHMQCVCPGTVYLRQDGTHPACRALLFSIFYFIFLKCCLEPTNVTYGHSVQHSGPSSVNFLLPPVRCLIQWTAWGMVGSRHLSWGPRRCVWDRCHWGAIPDNNSPGPCRHYRCQFSGCSVEDACLQGVALLFPLSNLLWLHLHCDYLAHSWQCICVTATRT